MLRWIRGITAVLGLATIGLAIAVYWLFYDNRLPREGRFSLDLAALRAAAGPVGAGPLRIEVEQLSHTDVPRLAMVAGTDWGNVDLVRASYRLVWPRRSVIVDTANPFAIAQQNGARNYDAAGWTRLLRAMDEAGAIVVTHEHADHIGGLMAAPDAVRLLAKARLTPEQVDAGDRSEPYRWPASVRARYRPLVYRGLYAVAPGVVLVHAPGHTPGSQLIYVRRADGHEFLFAGDAASMLDNVRLQRIRSRYVTSYSEHHADARRAVMRQTMALHRLVTEDPALTIVPGHDGATFEALIRRGLLVRGFRFTSPVPTGQRRSASSSAAPRLPAR